ncbi:hypothetical protein, conserved [Trypanosoma brucei brucei TREU927]|uniref:Uncharacterized protein n=1 Tax=Trypanosoma brucei brucei (strain 927/4 GUTat10.1) TaxID=185431 RepID=Q382R1_TRYB2|nr:hypothetical protein, conserved [Trypanosoma brucei brucei TREU927]EAN80220.1 hypothetical protein, conserved [Trypanosoma brucei brucei TREU927]
MHLTLGVLTEDEDARTALSEAVENQCLPRFENNDGPLLDVWLGERKLFGLVERVAPNNFLQVTSENGGTAKGESTCADDPHDMRVTDNVSFIIRLSSVPHTSLQPGFTAEDAFVNCTRIVMAYSAQLERGASAELVGSDASAEYMRFTEK